MEQLEFRRGLRNGDLYDTLIDPLNYNERLLVTLRKATGSETHDVTEYRNFSVIEDAFRHGQFIARNFYKDVGWKEGIIARHYRGTSVIAEISADQSFPKLAKGDELWRMHRGEPQMIAIGDPERVGVFQSENAPVSEAEKAAVAASLSYLE